jgi:hypothetical protein
LATESDVREILAGATRVAYKGMVFAVTGTVKELVPRAPVEVANTSEPVPAPTVAPVTFTVNVVDADGLTLTVLVKLVLIVKFDVLLTVTPVIDKTSAPVFVTVIVCAVLILVV